MAKKLQDTKAKVFTKSSKPQPDSKVELSEAQLEALAGGGRADWN